MMTKAVLILHKTSPDADVQWTVWVDGHKVSGPFPARALAVDWIYVNGYRLHDGEWVKEIIAGEL